MKKIILTLVSTFISMTALADGLVAQPAYMGADIQVHYYINNMPIIIDEGEEAPDRRYFSAHVTVEFCRTVSKDEFELNVDEVNGTNYISLAVAGPILDCFGPTHKQTLVYPLRGINKDLPFAIIKPVYPILDGVVH